MADALPLPRSAVLVVNAQSRKGQQLFRHACARLKAAGVDLTATHAVHDPDALPRIVADAIRDGAPMVIVGGGDGSLSSAVDAFVGTPTVLAILPLGTANSAARSLGLPLDLDGAVAVIARGHQRQIDLGMIGNDYYMSCAAIGISPLIAETVPHGLKKLLGRAGYLGWAAFQLTRFRAFRLTVHDGSRSETLDALEVRIANGPYHGGSAVVDGADPTSGEIVVQAVTGRSRLTLLWSWAASVLHLPARRHTTRAFHGREIRVETEPPMAISIDGEVLARTPVTARVAPRAVAVAVPAR